MYVEDQHLAQVGLPRRLARKENLDILTEWLNPIYVKAYRDETLKAKFFKTRPFAHVSLQELLRIDKLNRLLEYAEAVKPDRFYQTDEPHDQVTQVYYSALEDLDAARFFYGPAFRSFLEKLSGTRVRRPPQGYPQIRVFTSDSYGFDIHNDEHAELDFVSILNLNRNWDEDCGGELCLWEEIDPLHKSDLPILHSAVQKEYQQYYRKVKEVAPKANSFNMLFFSKNSFHSVSPIKAGFTRRNLLMEWKFLK